MILKTPLPGSEALLQKVQECLGPNRLPLLIAIDGADGVGKSSLASWLAWQLGAPAIHLDLYLVRASDPLRWRSDELRRAVNTRLVEHAGPLIVEGILVLDALGKIRRKPDYLVYVDGEGGHSLSTSLRPAPGGHSAVEPTAPLSRHYPHDARRSGSGLGAAPWSKFALQRQPSVRQAALEQLPTPMPFTTGSFRACASGSRAANNGRH